ncbi:hypothetical protein COV20_04630 [Candidatus Woesearchaeota archaeon CG10_big_fil_rev_8_21_14_0_10_45_16]|nr:MAG: hypothetical protein COV20_04630 [Candidatus Woesearchaeota archaeon CG10_big_fil_rev_8_21_14_0_10_45_16]
MVWINQMESLRTSGRKTFLKYMVNKDSRRKVYQEWKKHLAELSDFQEKLRESDLQKMDESEFKKTFDEFFRLTIDFWVDTIPPELGNYGSEDVLREELMLIKEKEELSSVMEILSTPEELSFYLEEEVALSETDDIKDHQQKYFWLQNSYAGTKILDKNYFAERKKDLPNDLRKKTEEKLEKVKSEKMRIAKKHNLSARTLEIAQAISDNIEWQDQRKKHIFINLHYKHILLEEVARRYSYPIKGLLNCGFDEVEKILEGEDLHGRLKERRDGFGLDFFQEARIIPSAEAAKCWEEYTYEKIIEEVDHFSGVVASKGQGVARGKAKIILDPFQAGSFRKGDILIAPMTSPEYVFLMEKAAAIITDTGGLTCHAAIVAREFGIPCIVGTKIATQVLKDGDLIEVNTEKGTVKKLQ